MLWRDKFDRVHMLNETSMFPGFCIHKWIRGVEQTSSHLCRNFGHQCLSSQLRHIHSQIVAVVQLNIPISCPYYYRSIISYSWKKGTPYIHLMHPSCAWESVMNIFDLYSMYLTCPTISAKNFLLVNPSGSVCGWNTFFC